MIWKALHNILPTKLNLYKKKVINDPRCPICLQGEESVVHVLWTCPASSDVWAEKGSSFQKWNSKGEDFVELWLKMVEGLPQSELERGVAIMHSIWIRRNKWVFDNCFSSPFSVMRKAQVCLDEFQEAQRESISDGRKMGKSQQRRPWQKPEELSVKVNFDAALDLNKKLMGAGVVIRDWRGDVLVSLCAQFKHVSSPFIAECKALGRAVELCKELGFYNVWFEGDAKRVVDGVNKEEEDESWEGQAVGDLQKELRGCRGWKLTFTHRECNEVAHCLAKIGLSIEMERVWMECVPPEIVPKVVNDKHCNQLNT
ncbi:uncharacterized protein LOC118348858 [Juglans regia]|uniref:Uncharacterized protein LOC118348858 n=1 Tax=Juglans regia TaxID=51240 RepID=A0A6P9EIP4_JUGRE|nr:uncharacterized protein LOC118348858 [Juglans regia]